MDTLTSRTLLDICAAIEQWASVMEQHEFPRMPEVQLELAGRIRGIRAAQEILAELAHDRHTYDDPSIADCGLCEAAFAFYASLPA